MRARAQAAGIDEATLRAAFDDVHYLPRVVELDRAQPEFTRTVWDYLDSTVTPQRVARGRTSCCRCATRPTPRPRAMACRPAVLVAIWGIESNYGDNYGNTPTIDALATLGFEGRREDWARGQLLAALKILQSGDIDRAHMIGSWAGAMGQTQFLPVELPGLRSGCRRRRPPRHLGQPGRCHGVDGELPLPARDGAPTSPGESRSSCRRGSTSRRADADAAQCPPRSGPPKACAASTARRCRSLPTARSCCPRARAGRPFWSGPNFRAILRYNNSTSYALAVSLLAQRLTDGAGVQALWPRDLPSLTRSQVQALQTALNERGFDSGTPDGMVGPATREALRRYQRSIGLPADGYPTLDLLQRLQAP